MSRLWILLLIGLCVLFVSSYTSRLMRKAQVDREIVEWEQRIDAAELRNLELQAELDYVNSLAYLDDTARSDLDMAREGDTVIIVASEPNAVGDSGVANSAVTGPEVDGSTLPSGPTWKQWIAILVGEE